MAKKEYEIRFLNKEGEGVYEKGTINDEPALDILKKHASEFPEPHVVFFNGRITSF